MAVPSYFPSFWQKAKLNCFQNGGGLEPLRCVLSSLSYGFHCNKFLHILCSNNVPFVPEYQYLSGDYDKLLFFGFSNWLNMNWIMLTRALGYHPINEKKSHKKKKKWLYHPPHQVLTATRTSDCYCNYTQSLHPKLSICPCKERLKEYVYKPCKGSDL